ncbi:MAG: HAMP domain-containing histidine kinase [Planctomycetes bacterium]|nr:HAMP domain-containing histidine kinase [Planctomycetota bacterium]
MENVFEPFFTTKTDGTGLGLVIVRKIIELHGGEVSIESEKKEGSTILLTLPEIQNEIPKAFSCVDTKNS